MTQVKKIIYSTILGLLFLGCKSTKTVQSNTTLDPKMSVRQIVKQHNKSQSEFKTLQGRIKVEYSQGDRSIMKIFLLLMGYMKRKTRRRRNPIV
jgi:hypothetical protein